MKMDTIKTAAIHAGTAIFVLLSFFLTIYMFETTFYYIKKLRNGDMSHGIYIMPFFILFFSLFLFSAHIVASTWKSGKSFRDYIAGTSIVLFGIIIPAPIITLAVGMVGWSKTEAAALPIFAVLSIGFAWIGFRLLRSRFFSTVAGRRPWQWALSILAIDLLAGWLIGVLIVGGIMSTRYG